MSDRPHRASGDHSQEGWTEGVRSATSAVAIAPRHGGVTYELLVTLTAFAALRFIFFPPAPLGSPWEMPVERYRGAGIIAEAFSQPLFSTLVLSTVALLTLNWLPWRWNLWRGRISWGDTLIPGARFLLFAIALPVAWRLSTYDVNLFFGEAHSLDRIALVLCWAGILLNPTFVPLFVALAATISSQFNHPHCFEALGDDHSLAFGTLLLFWVVFVLSRLRPTRAWLFPALALCQWAAYYAAGALGRLTLGGNPAAWVLENRLSNRLLGAHINGWLAEIPRPDLIDAARSLATISPAIQLALVCFGMAACMVLMHRRLALALCAGAVAVELLMFGISGVLRWDRLLTAIVLGGLIYDTWSRAPIVEMFTERARLWSVALIALSLPVFAPPKTGAFDSRLYITYDLEIEDATGTRYELSHEAMEPYDRQLAANRLGFANPRPTLGVDAFGAARELEMFRLLEEAGSVGELIGLRERHGVVRYEEARARDLEAFLRTYFAEWNEARGSRATVPSWLRPPRRLHSGLGAELEPDSPPVRRVRLYVRETFFDGRALHVLDDTLVIEVRIPIPGEIAPL